MTDKYTNYAKAEAMPQMGISAASPLTTSEKAELKMRIMLAISQKMA